MSGDRPGAWVAVLDALELKVAATEAMLADCQLGRDLPTVDPWSPPRGLGPLPVELQPRADAILTRQLAVATAVARAAASARQQAVVAFRLQTGRDAVPAYLDQAL
ncbi:MAG TPA: hypothetical protein VMU51_19610 [Mycobacteriales bacterium]|nr:hypothetical protein [Mycobacteriales bacterium]